MSLRTWCALGALLPVTALAGPLEIASATASSTYSEQPGYDADKVFDGKQGSSWVEGESGSGLGAWIELDLGGEKTVEQVRIWGGDWSSWEYWNRANRPKEVELKFSDGSAQVVTLKDEKVAQTFAIEGGGKKTSTVRLRLKSTYNGTTWFDTGISEVQLLGASKDGRIVGAATASSVAKEDGDGNYQPANAVDGLVDSMWCEGDAGDGTGQWLAVDFGEPRTISKVSLVDGIGSSMALWFKANQATSLQLAYSDGSTHVLAIDRPSFRLTTYDLPQVTTSSVKLTVTGVKPGKEFNDLCLSEVSFAE